MTSVLNTLPLFVIGLLAVTRPRKNSSGTHRAFGYLRALADGTGASFADDETAELQGDRIRGYVRKQHLSLVDVFHDVVASRIPLSQREAWSRLRAQLR